MGRIGTDPLFGFQLPSRAQWGASQNNIPAQGQKSLLEIQQQEELERQELEKVTIHLIFKIPTRRRDILIYLFSSPEPKRSFSIYCPSSVICPFTFANNFFCEAI